MKRTFFLSLCLLMALGVYETPAMAKKPDFAGHGNKPEKNMPSDEHTALSEGGRALALFFSDSQKNATRAYLRNTYRPNCPPGLAKKNNGCLPPGQAKKYAVGGTLPHDYGHPPKRLLELLGPPPVGAYYAMVDKDVLLISEATKKVLDAVTLMSAME